MADLVTLQARLEAIQASRDAGVLMVRHGDTSTQFRSLAEMNQIISDLKREIAKLTGTSRSKVNYIEESHRGYGPPGYFNKRDWQ
jgi:hypothetical protein